MLSLFALARSLSVFFRLQLPPSTFPFWRSIPQVFPPFNKVAPAEWHPFLVQPVNLNIPIPPLFPPLVFRVPVFPSGSRIGFDPRFPSLVILLLPSFSNPKVSFFFLLALLFAPRAVSPPMVSSAPTLFFCLVSPLSLSTSYCCAGL